MDNSIKGAMMKTVRSVPEFQFAGEIHSVQGTITVKNLEAAVGDVCWIRSNKGQQTMAEVIGFADDLVHLLPFSAVPQIQRGDLVISTGQKMEIATGAGLLGRVVNAFGEPIDGLGSLKQTTRIPLTWNTPNALSRKPVCSVFVTGQRAIDSAITIGMGQRVGLFAGSGVGKSTLLGQIAQQSASDMNVVALIGERGREVAPMIQHSLGFQGLKKSVVIVSTADECSLAKVRAAETAIALSHWFRDTGKNVMLILDSITRFAAAQRDIGLLLGEPPTARGYTPSVFQRMGQLLEQLGNSDRGSITSLISVLVDGDDLNDPVADSARSILDGHIVLDRDLANSGHFPAIDVLKSASRVFTEVNDQQHQDCCRALRQILATYRNVVDLVQVGAYQRGVNRKTDLAIDMQDQVNDFLQQPLNQPTDISATRRLLEQIAIRWNQESVSTNGPIATEKIPAAPSL